MSVDEDFWPCRPWTGRRLLMLRVRYRLLWLADKYVHRLHIHDHNGVWPCFEADDIWCERFSHDRRFHTHRLQFMSPVRLSGPPQ